MVVGKSLQDSVAVLPGVGPKRVQALSELKITTIADLLHYFPFRYEDLKVVDLNEAADQEKVTLKGTVVSDPIVSRFGRGRNRLNVRLLIEHDVIMVTFFNQPWLKDKFVTGAEVAIYGKWDAKRKSLTGMKVLAVKNSSNPAFASIYSVSKNIHQSTLVKLIRDAFTSYQDCISDIIPAALQQKYRLLSEKATIAGMHFPKTQQEANAARRTAIFEEFFLFQMTMQLVKQREQAPQEGMVVAYDNQKLRAFIKTLPFELTNAQKRVVNEICRDLKSVKHMNRLLQGDVGSGKTIVAAIVMYAAVTAGLQAALMAPTEILAEQHYKNLTKLFAPFNVKIVLLTGSTKTKVRKEILAGLAAGTVQMIIGTHALIQKGVDFADLGLAITDEQHRFGVNQRRILREKGYRPDILAMTATPIPRTLAITAFGEMDVSTIDELPAGRIPIKTSWIRSNQVPNALTFMQKELAKHNQAYVITPLIEESESMDLKNAQEIYQNMQLAFEPTYQVGLLHGQMKADEKESVMADFKANDFQVLVATTVIEVGVDVPNATTMLIFDADRFGLSQLHQLRGRIGRGKAASFCILVADPKNQTGIERMQVMTETNDGFKVSQKDLELRGPGDVLGEKQSGMPEFKVGDPVADFAVLETAQLEAQKLLTNNNLDLPANEQLKAYLEHETKAYQNLD
ncbi:ATP-dependent DNA helicase RecG [Loigolactobacillus backii]|uniref:ATP-dependent DNA helicase RecG n=1 Tax=Loigolactobacillus backii TaxID=375175 RepID=A0A192H2K1_9LACO|nr:ATP-dependent DNA helicase RecG [Loigolactobacillus backii]ANK63039.1 ATP-dependent DNA helicase RecG [Loigolactobacillus backii]ANK69953.1 ATP-dependent DNA helicase RecG [Loigolactobacillus backii]MDA5388332.1 ATP-dependent DNA helicase RecG [Loigolactobacillus backii]MDA5390822.1 ATP-dependent DNA helicase RecG [Loigolactobacillus backii]PIO83295.1 DNA helicase RecG [Loigolactobacillus backii]